MTIEKQVQSLEAQIEELRQKVEKLSSTESSKGSQGGMPNVLVELAEKLDDSKEVDAGVLIGCVLRTKHGTGSSLHSCYGELDSWVNLPASYVAQLVQPFADARCLAILKAFVDGAEKSMEELLRTSGANEEELGELIAMLAERGYIRWEKKQSVIDGRVVSRDVFSVVPGGNGILLLLVLLYLADVQRKHKEEKATPDLDAQEV